MKKMVLSLMLAAMAAFPLAGFGQASIENDPAYLPIDKLLDLKANPPQVNVNLPQFLLKDALSGLNNTNFGTEGMDLSDVVKDVKLIRVVVFDGSQNKADFKHALKALQAELDAKWISIVNVSDDKDKVGIYAKADKSGEAAAGIAVLVYDGDGNDTVVANVIGKVSIAKLIRAASQSKMIPQDLLKKLQNGSGGLPATPAATGQKKEIQRNSRHSHQCTGKCPRGRYSRTGR
jgi:hypothetical protein